MTGFVYMKKYLKRFLPLSIPVVFFLLLILCSGPPLLMRKVIVFLCLPAGIVWVLLSFAIFWPGLPKLHRIYVLAVWIIYTLAGNPLVGNRLVRPLEAPYANNTVPEKRLEYLIVLGGGTGADLAGGVQLGSAGDRVMTAARLYKQGKVEKLIAGGRSITEIGQDRDLAGESKTIWMDLGIPASDIITFTEPRNTEEEIIVYRDYINSLPNPPQGVGICTSAWHLMRAEKVWKKHGLDAVPVASDFRSRPIPFLTTYLIPKKRGFADIQLALWEYLGLLFD